MRIFDFLELIFQNVPSLWEISGSPYTSVVHFGTNKPEVMKLINENYKTLRKDLDNLLEKANAKEKK